MASSVAAPARPAQVTSMSEQSKALSPVREGELVGSGPIESPDTFKARIESLRQRFNIIAPPVQVVGGFFPGYAIVAAQVLVDTTVNEDGQGPDTYVDKGFMKPGQRALNKNGLAKICSAAGVKWVPEQTGRRDDGKEPYRWHYEAYGIVDTADGGYQIITGAVEIDLRDGSPQIGEWTPEKWAALMAKNDRLKREDPNAKLFWSINGWSEQRVRQARVRGLALAETKAKNRAIRSIGLQQVYTMQELEKPFLVFRAMYQPDMSDPVIRQMVAERALHGRRTLYPHAEGVSARALPSPAIPPAGTIDAVADADEPPTQTPPVTSTAASDPPPLRVAGVEQVSHEGRAMLLWDVRFSDGRVARTKDEGVRELALKAQAGQLPVDATLVASSKRPGALNIDELRVLQAAPGVPQADDLY